MLTALVFLTITLTALITTLAAALITTPLTLITTLTVVLSPVASTLITTPATLALLLETLIRVALLNTVTRFCHCFRR